MRALARIVVVMALLLVAGCGTGDTSPAEAKRPAVPPNPDRDRGAVLAALTRIDACALIDPARVQAPGFTGREPFSQASPQFCLVKTARGETIEVDLLATFIGSERWRGWQRLILGEAVGYLLKNTRCDLVIPVSFQFAIKFSIDRRRCESVRVFAAAAVTQLANPAGPGPIRPAQWDACGLLGRALGSDHPPHPQALDQCISGKTRLQFQYNKLKFDAHEYPEPVTIAGRSAGLTPFPDQCVLRMDQGPTGLPHPRPAFQRVLLAAPTCSEATKVATAVAGLLSTPRPPGRVQAPLYFRPNEPDQAAPGGCAYVEFRTDYATCEPYASAGIPKAAELHGKAQADPQVLCAIAVEPVRERFGERLKPVVSGQRCHFLEGGERLKLVISSSGDPLEPDPDRAFTVEGRPAERAGGHGGSRIVRIGLGETSQLSIEYSLFTTREGPTPHPEDAAVLAKLDSMVPDVVRQLK